MNAVARKRYPRVTIWTNMARSHGRQILKGIAEYVETYGPWEIFVNYPTPHDAAAGVKHWRGDGLLGYTGDSDLTELLARSSVPAVDLLGNRPDLKIPQVGNDEAAIGRIAAEHLLERKFKQFGFSGYPYDTWSIGREKAFKETTARAGYPCEVFHCLWPAKPTEWEELLVKMMTWLQQLPKPCGLMACSDHNAQLILSACRRCGISAPEEIAVIGVGNDEENCRFCEPPLTSVIADTYRVGYEGARLLDQMMSRKLKSRAPVSIVIPPVSIATRRSTDVTAIDDRLVAGAVRYIREHACEGINVIQLPKIFGVSRSVFYRRFQDALQRSPHDEIVRIQLERVKGLLTQTKLPLEKIAELSGFEYPAYMNVCFKRKEGKTPGRFRREAGKLS